VCPNDSHPDARSCEEGDHKLVCVHFINPRGNRCKKGQSCTFIHPGKITAVGDCASAEARWKEIQAARAAGRPVTTHALVQAPVLASTNIFAALADDGKDEAPVRSLAVATPVNHAYSLAQVFSAGRFPSLIVRLSSAGRLQLNKNVRHWHEMTTGQRLAIVNAKELAKWHTNPTGQVFVPLRADNDLVTERSALGLCTLAISQLLNSSRGLAVTKSCEEGCMKGLSWNQRDGPLLDLCRTFLNGTETFASIYGKMVETIQSGACSRLLANPHVSRAWYNMPDVPKLAQADLENMSLIFEIIKQSIKVARNPKIQDGWAQLGMTPQSAKKFIAFMQLFAPMCQRSLNVCKFMLEREQEADENKQVRASHICTYTCDTCIQGTHLPEVDLAHALGQFGDDSKALVRAFLQSKFAPIRLCRQDAMYGKCACNRSMTDAERIDTYAELVDQIRAMTAEKKHHIATLETSFNTTSRSELAGKVSAMKHLEIAKKRNSGILGNEQEAALLVLEGECASIKKTDDLPEVIALRARIELLSSGVTELAIDFLTNVFPLIHSTSDMGLVALMDDPKLMSLKPVAPFSGCFNQTGLIREAIDEKVLKSRLLLRQLLQASKRVAPVAVQKSKALFDFQLERKKEKWNSLVESEQAEVERLHAMYNTFEDYVANCPKHLDVKSTGSALDLVQTVEGRADFDLFLASKPLAGKTFADWIAADPVRVLALSHWRATKKAWPICKHYVHLGLTSEVMTLESFATYNPITMKLWVGVNKERSCLSLTRLTIDAFLADQDNQIEFFYRGGHKFSDFETFEADKKDGWNFILTGTYKLLSEEDQEKVKASFVDKIIAMAAQDPLILCSFEAQSAQAQSVLVAVAACPTDEARATCMAELGVTEAGIAAMPASIQLNTELIATVTAKLLELKEAAAKVGPKSIVAKAAAAVRVKRAADAEVVEIHQTAQAFFQGEDRFAKEEKLHYRIGNQVICHEDLPTWVKQRKVDGELRRIHVADVTEDAVRKEQDVKVRFLALGPFPTLGMATECLEAIAAFPHTSSIMPRVEPYFGEDGDEDGFIQAMSDHKDEVKRMRREKVSGEVDVPCATSFGGCYMVVIPHVKSKEATRKDKQSFKRAVATEDWVWVRGLIEFIAPKLDLQHCDFWTNMRATESTRVWLDSVKHIDAESESESDESDDDEPAEDDDDEFDDEPVTGSRLFARPSLPKKVCVAAPVAAPAAAPAAAPVESKPTKPGQQKERLSQEQILANLEKEKKDAAAAKELKVQQELAKKAAKDAHEAIKEAKQMKFFEDTAAAAEAVASKAVKEFNAAKHPETKRAASLKVASTAAAAKLAVDKLASYKAAHPALAAPAAPAPVEEEEYEEEEYDEEEYDEEEYDEEEYDEEEYDDEDLEGAFFGDGNVRAMGKK
jgi:hypothetical protein